MAIPKFHKGWKQANSKRLEGVKKEELAEYGASLEEVNERFRAERNAMDSFLEASLGITKRTYI